MLSKLIEALQIFLKYGDVARPTHCEHDIMYICNGLEKDAISEEDQVKLKELGFSWNESENCWSSYKYGSA